MRRIAAMRQRLPLIRAARGRGLLFAIELQAADTGRPVADRWTAA